MAYNFLRAARDQPFLLPPDLRDWLPEGHLAWFILDVVDQLDPAPFYRARRDGGHGHPAHDPKTLLGVLLYAYCLGVRSFRQVERRCTDELLASLASPTGRLARLRVAKALLEAEAAARQQRYETRVAELAAAARARGKQPKARIKPRRRDEAPDPKRVANVTDPDSRLVRTRKGSLQGYNAQAVTTCEQVIVAAELTQQAADLQQLRPMLEATAATLAAPGIADRPRTLLADAGYWTIANLTEIEGAPELLIPPARHGRQGKPRKDGRPSESRSDGLRTAMTAKLQSDQGKARYAKRKQTVEPVFGQVKDARGARHPATRHAGHHLSRERHGTVVNADYQRGTPARASLAQPSRFLSDRAEAERAFALGAPVVALAAAAATSALLLGLRVGFLHRRPAREVG